MMDLIFDEISQSEKRNSFKLEVNFDLKSYEGEINAEKLGQWLKQMEVYFHVKKIENDEEKIEITTLKLEGHHLVWWKNYLDVVVSFEEMLVKNWIEFKTFLKN